VNVRNLITQASSIVMSLLFAVIVWVVATNEENPTREALFQDPLPIEFANRASNLLLYEKSADEVHVRVRAPEASWANLRAANFQAVADLGSLSSGVHDLPINVKVSDPRVIVLAVDPAVVNVHLEALKQVTTEVRVRLLDVAPEGYEVRTPVTDPPKVTITGPQVIVDQVNDATVDVALRSAKTTVDRDAAVVLHDAQGNQIRNLTVIPGTVSVHVPIEQKVGYKDVAIKATVKGTVASGYWVSDISMDPANVTLIGAPEALAKIPGFVEADAVTVTGAKSDVTKRVGLTLPTGVSVLNPSDIIAHVAVEPVLGGITIRRKVGLADSSCTLAATLAPDTVDVILSGPLPILQALSADDVQIVVDLDRCERGTFQSTPRAVNVPASLKVESIVPNTAEITLKPK
jgi:YbbR domain-containing protein